MKHNFYWHPAVQNFNIWSHLDREKGIEHLDVQPFLIQLYHMEKGENEKASSPCHNILYVVYSETPGNNCKSIFQFEIY